MFSPGCYGSNISISDRAEFAPGLYILDGAELRINGNATVNGEGVTFALTNRASLDFRGGSLINFSAPLPGSGEPYPGILFFGATDNDLNQIHRINGTAGTTLQGVIYLPSDDVDFTGDAGFESECARIVADTIQFSGNSNIGGDCAGILDNVQIAVGGRISIIE